MSRLLLHSPKGLVATIAGGGIFMETASNPPSHIPAIVVPQEVMDKFCARWKVHELSLFGSVLRPDFGPTSDVDVLVSFEEQAPWSLWDLITMRDELTLLFGRPVHLVEKEGLRNPIRRDRILATRRIIHVKG